MADPLEYATSYFKGDYKGAWDSLFGGGGETKQSWRPPSDPLEAGQYTTRSYMQTNAPKRLDEFRRGAEPLISDMFRGQYLQGTETLAAGKQQADRQAQDQFSAMGIAPSVYQGRIQPGQDQQYAQQSAALRGQAVMSESEARLNLQAQIMNALNQTEAYYDSLKLQNHLRQVAGAQSSAASHEAAGASVVGAGLTAAALAFSDAELKSDVRTIGKLSNGVRLVRWRWNGAAERLGLRGESTGVVAQELARVRPDLVRRVRGYLAVNYAGL